MFHLYGPWLSRISLLVSRASQQITTLFTHLCICNSEHNLELTIISELKIEQISQNTCYPYIIL